MVTVDVTIPCYNYGHYLRDCVESVLSQSGVQVRVLVIDDCSSDDTPEVGRALAAADPRVQFRRHAANKGHIATYNEGIEAAGGDYFVLLSADDLLTPGALERATALMESHPSVGFVYGYAIPLYGTVPPAPRTKTWDRTVWSGPDWIQRMCRSGKNFIESPEVVMRTSVLRKIGGYRADLPHTADMHMWLQAAAISDVGRINGADQAYYRIHSSSMQRTIHAGVMRDLRGRLRAFETALEERASQLADPEGLLGMAKRALAMIAVEHVRRAYEQGEAAAQPVDELCEFATSLFPAVSRTAAWRSLQRLRARQPNGMMKHLYRAKAGFRRVKDHLVWRNWWRTGVF